MRLDNRVISAIVRSRMHRLLSGTVVLLRYHGRKSGNTYTIPVQYARSDGELILFGMKAAKKQWWRNLGARSDVEVLLQGVWRPATARVVAGDETLARRYVERFRYARLQIPREEQPIFVVLSLAEPLT